MQTNPAVEQTLVTPLRPFVRLTLVSNDSSRYRNVSSLRDGVMFIVP